MIFDGIRRVFSTENDRQYETIGAFWDEMSLRYGLENLRGLGCNWTENTIEYVIGLKEGTIQDTNFRAELPDEGWAVASGRTDDLAKMYERIYADGRLRYEIETFTEGGDCEVLYCR